MASSGVTYQDIADELGRSLTPEEQAKVTQWISDAEVLVTNRLGSRIADVEPEVYALVVRMAVLRRLERGEAGSATSRTVSVDDASVTNRWVNSSDVQTGSVWWFLPEWWQILAPDASGAFSTRPDFVPGSSRRPDWWGYEVGNHAGPSLT